jgi:hypothetical protein
VKGLEDLPMRELEQRVRDAFGAAAETVTAQDLPGPPAPARRSWTAWSLRARAPRMRMNALVPIAAAACVTVIVVTATLVVPRLLAGPPAGRTNGAPAGLPKFFAGVAEYPLGQYPPSTVLHIYRSTTGRVVATIQPPGHDHVFAAVSRLGSSDRTYVAAAMTSFRGCKTQLYRFSIDPQGRPSGLTPLSVPRVTGSVMELVSSADGNVLAYTASGRCAPGHQIAGVIHLATRQVTTWAISNGPLHAGSISLTADGSVLGFAAGGIGPSGPQDAWVLPTNAPPGPLTRHARKVVHVPTGVFRVILNSTGSQAYVETQSAPRGGVVVLGLYSTTTGKRIRLLGPLDPRYKSMEGELDVTMDAAGQHLLIYTGSHRVTMMNLATGHVTSIRVAQIPFLDSPFNSAAW